MSIAVLVAYVGKYATLIPEIIWSRGPSPGDLVLGLIILSLNNFHSLVKVV